MAMTAAQAATFKAAVIANAALATFRTAGDASPIVAYYNSPGTGFVYRSDLSAREVVHAIKMSEFVALTPQVQAGLHFLLLSQTIDATAQNIRDGFAAMFSSSPTTLAQLNALAQRVPTRFEALFATSSITPLFGYSVTPADVGAALA